MKYKKEIIGSIIYISLSIGLYLILDMKEYGEIFDIINMLGVGVFLASMLIKGIESLSNKMIDSGRLEGVKKIEGTIFTKYTFIIGINSVILSIVRVFI